MTSYVMQLSVRMQSLLLAKKKTVEKEKGARLSKLFVISAVRVRFHTEIKLHGV